MRKRIVDVCKDFVKLENGDWVQLSDKLYMNVDPKINDVAIVKDFKGGRLVIDILSSSGFVNKELEKQKMEFIDLVGGY